MFQGNLGTRQQPAGSTAAIRAHQEHLQFEGQHEEHGAGEWARISACPLAMVGDSALTPGCCETLGGRSQDSRITSTEHKGQVSQHNGTDLLQHGTHPLTSFSPQILLIIELEAGLEEGPRTPTTPLGRI